MKKTFVMRGQTVSGGQEVLEFGGKQKETKGMAYRLVEFQLYGTTNLGGAAVECFGTITAGKTAVAPTDPDFKNIGLIGTAFFTLFQNSPFNGIGDSIINDTFLITQNLILMVQDTNAGTPINWQCRFEAVKMTDAETAATNFKQYSIFDE